MSTMYTPQHDPPLAVERFLATPGMAVLALWTAMVAFQVALDPFSPGVLFSLALGELEPRTAILLGTSMLLGGVGALVGMLNSWDNRTRAWALERGAWVLVIAGWLSYAIIVARTFPGSTISWGSPLFYCLMAGARIVALVLTEKAARRNRAVKAAVDTLAEQGREGGAGGPATVEHPGH